MIDVIGPVTGYVDVMSESNLERETSERRVREDLSLRYPAQGHFIGWKGCGRSRPRVIRPVRWFDQDPQRRIDGPRCRKKERLVYAIYTVDSGEASITKSQR